MSNPSAGPDIQPPLPEDDDTPPPEIRPAGLSASASQAPEHTEHNTLIVLQQIEKLVEKLKDLKEDDSQDDDDMIEQVLLSKKYVPTEVQAALQQVIDRQKILDDKLEAVADGVAAFMTVFMDYTRSVHNAERQATAHGNNQIAGSVVKSEVFVNAVNDLLKLYEKGQNKSAGVPKRGREEEEKVRVNHKRIRYSVALLLNKEHKDADKRYRVPYVPDQQMLRASEWPTHVTGGVIQRNVYDKETDRLVQKTFYRPDLRNLNKDPKSQEFLAMVTKMVLEREPESARGALEKVVEKAIKTHCKYAINNTTPTKGGAADDDDDEDDDMTDPKAQDLRDRAAKAKVKNRRQKRTNAIVNGRIAAYPKSPYIRSSQAQEYKYLAQPELGPVVLSEDEGDAYHTLEVDDDSEDEDGEAEDDAGPAKYSAWNYYQRQNNNGEEVVRKDGSPKAFYELLDAIHRADLGSATQMHETWVGPRWAWRDDSKDLPIMRPPNPENNAIPAEGPNVKGVVVFQHWLSPEILNSKKKEHKTWVGQCYPKPLPAPDPSGLTNRDLEQVMNSKQLWSEAFKNARRLVEPIEPDFDEEKAVSTVNGWKREEKAKRAAARSTYQEID